MVADPGDTGDWVTEKHTGRFANKPTRSQSILRLVSSWTGQFTKMFCAKIVLS